MRKRKTRTFCTYNIILPTERRSKRIDVTKFQFFLTSRLIDGKSALNIEGQFRPSRVKIYCFILAIFFEIFEHVIYPLTVLIIFHMHFFYKIKLNTQL